MYLHNNTDIFKKIIIHIASKKNIDPNFIEKDYYITIILKCLKSKCSNIIFKGGTSLSKCFGIINRFSEDIDISFEEHIGESKRSRLKNTVVKSISNELNLPIINWDVLHSNSNVNKYIFSYKSVLESVVDTNQNINLEISLVLPSYPFIKKSLSNYIYNYIDSENSDIISNYNLTPFYINCQTIERTFVDKLFAICDYYLLDKATRLSRHLYDLHKLAPYVNIKKVVQLIPEIQQLRSKIDLCPSAKSDVNIKNILSNIINSNYYKSDYRNVTSLLIYDKSFVTTAGGATFTVPETSASHNPYIKFLLSHSNCMPVSHRLSSTRPLSTVYLSSP